MPTKTCCYCGALFTPPRQEPMCRACWFSGRHFLPTFQTLLVDLTAIPGVTAAYVTHTGGGCWAIQIERADKTYVLATDATPPARPGDPWDTAAILPETDNGPWLVGLYPYTPQDGEDDWSDDGPALAPLDRATLLAYVRGFARGEGVSR